jgi:hypothetical protein
MEGIPALDEVTESRKSPMPTLSRCIVEFTLGERKESPPYDAGEGVGLWSQR